MLGEEDCGLKWPSLRVLRVPLMILAPGKTTTRSHYWHNRRCPTLLILLASRWRASSHGRRGKPNTHFEWCFSYKPGCNGVRGRGVVCPIVPLQTANLNIVGASWAKTAVRSENDPSEMNNLVGQPEYEENWWFQKMADQKWDLDRFDENASQPSASLGCLWCTEEWPIFPMGLPAS